MNALKLLFKTGTTSFSLGCDGNNDNNMSEDNFSINMHVYTIEGDLELLLSQFLLIW